MILLFVSCSEACRSDSECIASHGNFCGVWQCTHKMVCEQKYPDYDACKSVREKTRYMVAAHNLSMSVACSEKLSRCIIMHYCLSDEDCFVSCHESNQCLYGKCRPRLPIPCKEEATIRASSSNDDNASVALLITFIVIFTIVTGLVVLCLLIVGVQNAREELANRRTQYASLLAQR